MKTTINIPKRASGAQKDSIGDGTLFYTGDVSDFNKSLSGWFIDNPPVLSPHHASIVWRYNHNLDRYILIHVQGSQVVSEAMGRYYPFRAGYEVSREDMNKIDFSLTSLFAALPRIATMTYGRVDLETVVEKRMPLSSGGNAARLARNIVAAIVTGRRLMVEITPDDDDSWRSDGIFNCLEMNTVLSAIDSIDIKLRRYATFAFCVDENYETVLDGVPVIFYRAGSAIQRSQNDICMTWLEAITREIPLTAQQAGMAEVFPYPGEDEPLLRADELLTAYAVFTKDTASLSGDEWPTWLKLGHQLTEVMPSSWQQFGDYYHKMNSTARKQYAAMVQDASLKWGVDGLTRELFSAVDNEKPYSDKQLQAMQPQALREHLENGKYNFLFPDGVPEKLITGLNAKYLEGLGLTSMDAVEKWYGIYSKYKRLKTPGVTEAFERVLTNQVYQLLDDKDKLQPDRIENLLEKCQGLRGEWSGLKDLVESAVSKHLFSANGKLSPAALCNVKNWRKLATLEERSPILYGLIEKAFKEDLDAVSDKDLVKLADAAINHYRPFEDEDADGMVEMFVDYLNKHGYKEKAKELEDMLNFSSRRKNGIKMLLLGSLLGLVLGGALGFFGYKIAQKGGDASASVAQSKNVVNFMPREKQNMMLMLAALPDSINEVHMDTLTLSLDSVRKDLRFLQPWNKLSLKSLEQMDSARITIRPLSDVEQFPDNVPNVISKNFSLYEMMIGRAFKVDSITILGKNEAFAIPSDSLMGPQDSTTLSANYYFKVINYIETHLSKEKIINLPY